MKWVPAVSGLVATLAALLVLGSVPSVDSGTPPAVPRWDEVDALAEATIASVSAVPTTVAVPTADVPAVEVAGVDEAVASALSDAGYAEFVGVDELRGTLPDSVLSLLISEHAVLLVEEGE